MILAYHIIFGAYGFRLPNDPRGSNSTFVRAHHLLPFGLATHVSHRHSVANTPHDRNARLAAKRTLMYPPVRFTGRQALAIAQGFANVVETTRCIIYACAIMPDHVHLVIARHTYPIEQLVTLLKGGATRELAKRSLHPLANHRTPDGFLPSPWGRNCRKVFLNSPAEIVDKIQYVQKNPLQAGFKLQNWSFVTRYLLPTGPFGPPRNRELCSS